MTDNDRITLFNKINNCLRNKVIIKSINPTRLIERLSNLKISNYNPSLYDLCKMYNSNNYPYSRHVIWEIFNNLTMDQLLVVEDLLGH